MPGPKSNKRTTTKVINFPKQPITSKRVESLLNNRNKIKKTISAFNKKQISDLLAKGDRKTLATYLIDLINSEQQLEQHISLIKQIKTPFPENKSFIDYLKKEASSLKRQINLKKSFLNKLLETDFNKYRTSKK